MVLKTSSILNKIHFFFLDSNIVKLDYDNFQYVAVKACDETHDYARRVDSHSGTSRPARSLLLASANIPALGRLVGHLHVFDVSSD